MTFCLGMKVRDGLVGLADTRLSAGAEVTQARKVSVHQHGRHSMFLMTSGLRSVRDKAVTYFDEVIADEHEKFAKLYEAANGFARQVRRVAAEDKQALEEAGLSFNLFTLLGGQLENDREHKLYLIYPQGNWIEVGEGTPYYIIGEGSYGKPLADRALRYDCSMERALKIGYLAFDATRTSASDVDFPIDVVLYRRGSYQMFEYRFERHDLQDVADWWQQRMRTSVDELPSGWVDALFAKLPSGPH